MAEENLMLEVDERALLLKLEMLGAELSSLLIMMAQLSELIEYGSTQPENDIQQALLMNWLNIRSPLDIKQLH